MPIYEAYFTTCSNKAPLHVVYLMCCCFRARDFMRHTAGPVGTQFGLRVRIKVILWYYKKYWYHIIPRWGLSPLWPVQNGKHVQYVCNHNNTTYVQYVSGETTTAGTLFFVSVFANKFMIDVLYVYKSGGTVLWGGGGL